MAVNILAVGESVPSRTATEILPIPIQFASPPQTLASLTIILDAGAPANNRVEINASIGVGGTSGVAQVLFRIFRDGNLIFLTQQGIQTAMEQFYVIKIVTADFNVPQGAHQYSLTVERSTGGSTASVAGPITFSALALGPIA
jgi:predicted proteasome-type protease